MQLHSLKQHWAGGSHLRKNKTGYHNHINSAEVTELFASSFSLRRSVFGACEEFPTIACQKCPTLLSSLGSPELKER